VRPIAYLVILAAGAVSLACDTSYAFRSPDPMQLTKRFREVEAMAPANSPETRAALIALCFSEKEPFQTKRFACRILSRVATSDDLAQAPAVARSDYLWVSWRLLGLRVAARESGQSAGDAAQSLLAFLRDLSQQAQQARLSGSDDWARRGAERDFAAREMGFYVSDCGLALKSFPADVVDRSPEIALDRLHAQYAAAAEPGRRAQELGALLKTEQNAFTREATLALLIDVGEPAVAAVEALIDANAPREGASPASAESRAYRGCLDVLAGVGGERAAALLNCVAASGPTQARGYASARLQWVEAGVGYRPLYARLFDHPYVDE
jgi:hypothetical protein